MSDFYESYLIVPDGSVPGEIEIAQPSGAETTRLTQVAVYEDIFDEDGNPTGQRRFIGWQIGGEDGLETETVPVLRGGYARVEERDGDVAVIVLATGEVLDQITALPDVLELDRYDTDTDPEEEEAVPASDIPPQAVVRETKPSKRKRRRKRKMSRERRRKIRRRLKRKKMREFPQEMDESGQVVEYVFSQFQPGWKMESTQIG